MKRKSIMVDMDDVMVYGGFLYLINEFMGTNYTEKDFTDFYMQDIVPNKEEFIKYFINHNMYDYCTIMDGAVEVLRELNEVYDVYIGTSYLLPECPDECGFMLINKFNFLAKNFPFISPYNYIFLGKKHVLNCDIKIDDSIKNLSPADMKILFSSYHNKNISDQELKNMNIIRANGWNDIRKILLDK